MNAYANLPFDSDQSRRDALVLASILAAHVVLVIALNSGLRLADPAAPPKWRPIELIEEARPPEPAVSTVATGPREWAPEPEPMPFPPVDIAPADTLPLETGPVITTGPFTGTGDPMPLPASTAPRPDARLVETGRWGPSMPASVRRLARTAGDLGTTVVRCVVGLSGRCDRVVVLESSGDRRLDDAAVRHAQRVWRFTPATSGGQPVMADYDLRIRWQVVD